MEKKKLHENPVVNEKKRVGICHPSIYKWQWTCFNMGVSKNRGTPKSSILIGFSIINHPFWGFSPYFWFNIHMFYQLKLSEEIPCCSDITGFPPNSKNTWADKVKSWSPSDSQVKWLLQIELPSCKLTNRHGKSTILMVFTRKDRDFHGRAVSFREGILVDGINPFETNINLPQYSEVNIGKWSP